MPARSGSSGGKPKGGGNRKAPAARGSRPNKTSTARKTKGCGKAKNDRGGGGGRKRKRNGGDDPGDHGGSMTGVRRDRDHTFCFNPTLVRMPTRADFTRSYGSLAAADYSAGPLKEPSVSHGFKASFPSVPDWNDDSPQLNPDPDEDIYCRFLPEGEHARKRKAKRQKTSPRAADENRQNPTSAWVQTAPAPSPDPPLQHVDDTAQAVFQLGQLMAESPAPISHTLITLPAEIRLMVLRHVLVAERPFDVHEGWTKVFKHQKTRVEISVLSAHSVLRADGERILYGENTFLYRLRDAQNHLINPVILANDDEGDDDRMSDGGGEDSDDASEYMESDDEYVPDAHDREPARAPDSGKIYINKFLHLFCHIVVEAEANRFGADTQQSMAAALRRFAAPASGAVRDDNSDPNICTLTIRVMPRWYIDHHTFVDFFAPSSPVMATLKKVECMRVQVDLLTRCLDHRYNPLAGFRLNIDTKHKRRASRAAAGLPDAWWADDRLAQKTRAELVDASLVKIDGLQRKMAGRCKWHQQELPEGVSPLRVAAMLGDWVDLVYAGDNRTGHYLIEAPPGSEAAEAAEAALRAAMGTAG